MKFKLPKRDKKSVNFVDDFLTISGTQSNGLGLEKQMAQVTHVRRTVSPTVKKDQMSAAATLDSTFGTNNLNDGSQSSYPEQQPKFQPPGVGLATHLTGYGNLLLKRK